MCVLAHVPIYLFLSPLIPLVLFYSFFSPLLWGYAPDHSWGAGPTQLCSPLANSTHEHV